MAIDGRLTDSKVNFAETINKQTLRLINYFAMDTIDKILYHIDRLNIRDTGTLRSTIKSVVQANSGGNEYLVRFYYIYYADCVEQAVGKYWGVDSDLGKGRGVRSENIHAPQIDSTGYGPMTAGFKNGVSATPNRTRTHRPRPFLRSEIKRQIDRISFRMMRDVGRNLEIHMLDTVADSLGNAIGDSIDVAAAILAPFNNSGYRIRTHYPQLNRPSV